MIGRKHDPGDQIVFVRYSTNTEKVYTVLDPPYTSHGKLRVKTPGGAVMTAWWDVGSYGSARFGEWRFRRAQTQ